ncbi:uncharacterized protein LOC123904263 [Trifolium pratense]|uniref:uncharacterized protein LOC123904263 n=1 Tax=Trifolium pratense TaxID=57577 RepID=UPI001E6906A8|nr:uncharacterized protein LOC123904263 [Trifolium pratense]
MVSYNFGTPNWYGLSGKIGITGVGIMRSATQLGVQAFQIWNDWYIAQNFQVTSVTEEHMQQHTWQPPLIGWLKCNVDARFQAQGSITTRGWCIRDETGQFVRARTAWEVGAHSIIEAEALALLDAMQSVILMNVEHIVFESDSEIVVDGVHTRYGGNSEFSMLISSIKSLLTLHSNFEVKFIKRQANSVAHLLAKAANSWPRRCGFYSLPLCIENQLMNDMN